MLLSRAALPFAIAAASACATAPPPAQPTAAPTPAAAAEPMPAATPVAAAAPGPATAPAPAPAAPAALPARPEQKTVQSYIRVSTPRVVLSHVRVIDGTGKPPLDDRNVVVERGKITAIEAGADVAAADGTTVLDLRGQSVMPGIVGMHDHLFYIARPNMDEDWSSEPPIVVPEMPFSSPRLYLAAGVTTLRTTGSVEPYTDLNLKREIDAGKLVGPHIDVTGPYLEGANSQFVPMHQLSGPDEARQFVNYWADRGATSFKAYMHITRAQLKAAIEAAHKRGIKVTGHLCSVTYDEAADLGIDDLEHGFWVNTQLDPGKQPDVCPPTSGGPTLAAMAPGSPEATALIAKLVKRHVAITSTLPVFEAGVPGRPPLRQQLLDMMTPEARQAYLHARKRPAWLPPAKFDPAEQLRRDMALERAFVAAGGLLLAGPDPTGNGGVLPGLGDQRAIELLVEAGFSPVEAIQIGTLNGARYLGRQDHIGSIAVGKNADLVVVKGDPSTRIADIENVEIVFKDGVGFDSAKLFASVKARYGQY
ncbi:MAG TPA: amidohydrolase family protein [Kofleriaceae bacterium]|nr:amidohydrolase family protein [Kofleriaceae bacterium]